MKKIKDIFNDSIILITIIVFDCILVCTTLFIVINNQNNPSTIYTNDGKKYLISSDYTLKEKSNYLEIDTGSDIIRIPWTNISSWEE